MPTVGARWHAPHMDVRARMAVEIAAGRYKYEAQRHADALRHVGLTPGAFWQYVRTVVATADAEATMPVEVRRLRRLAEGRAGGRGGVVLSPNAHTDG